MKALALTALKTTLAASILVAMFNVQAVQALELLSYKNTSTGATRYTDAQVEKVWGSGTPACIKDGSKLLGVNKAFRSKNLGYRDCSKSKKALRKQELTGISVVVFGVTELSSKLAKSVLGIK